MADIIAAEKVVQVPQMAESITEGTLKQFSKRELVLLPELHTANREQRLATMLSRMKRSQPLRPTR